MNALGSQSNKGRRRAFGLGSWAQLPVASAAHAVALGRQAPQLWGVQAGLMGDGIVVEGEDSAVLVQCFLFAEVALVGVPGFPAMCGDVPRFHGLLLLGYEPLDLLVCGLVLVLLFHLAPFLVSRSTDRQACDAWHASAGAPRAKP